MLSKHEWRWLTLCILTLFILIAAPALWGWLAPPSGWQLYRGWFFSNDYTQYRSAMAQGYAGEWLIINRFTPEPHTPVLQYPLYVLLGHSARWLHLPLEVPYVVTSGAALVALTYALYACAATFLPDTRDRKLAFLLALSVGPNWVISILQAFMPTAEFLSRYTGAISRAEFNTFLLFAAPPHLPWALTLLLLILRDVYRQWQTTTPLPVWRFVLSYLLLPLCLGLLNPFSLPTLLLPLGVLWAARLLQTRRLVWLETQPVLVMGCVTLPLVIYNLLAFTQDPFWGKAYGSQNYQPAFAVDVVLMGYGVLGLLAILGVVQMWRSRLPAPTAPPRLVFFWSVIVFLMSYIPVSYQRRFSLGLAPALTLLAVPGWRWLTQQRALHIWRRKRVLRILGTVLLILCLWGQNLLFYSAYALSHVGTGPLPYSVFQPCALKAAAAYLDAEETATSVVVLTCEEVGNILAGEIQGRVVLGHTGATLDIEARRKWVAAFFTGDLSTDEQAAWLETHRVSHILTSAVDHLECGLAYTPPAGWKPVFSQEGIHIYAPVP